MKIVKATALLVCAMFFTFHNAPAQDQKMTPEQMAQMEKMWKELKTPGPEHKGLENMVGEWNATTKAGDPNMPPEKGTCSNKWAMGGLFVESRYTGTMMGQPFHGVGYFGYDKTKKKYNGVWIDDASSAISTMEGTYDPATKTVTYMGKMDSPWTGEMNKDVKYVTRIIDKNNHTFEMHDPSLPADQSMQFQITYTRK